MNVEISCQLGPNKRMLVGLTCTRRFSRISFMQITLLIVTIAPGEEGWEHPHFADDQTEAPTG